MCSLKTAPAQGHTLESSLYLSDEELRNLEFSPFLFFHFQNDPLVLEYQSLAYVMTDTMNCFMTVFRLPM